jgi:hypothetical protein
MGYYLALAQWPVHALDHKRSLRPWHHQAHVVLQCYCGLWSACMAVVPQQPAIQHCALRPVPMLEVLLAVSLRWTLAHDRPLQPTTIVLLIGC